MEKSVRESLNEQLKDPEFKEEWDALEPEFQVIRAILKEKKKKNITQKELAELTGIAQADISRMENGNANPSLQTLKRLAAGLGTAVKVDFVPLSKSI